MNIIIPAFLLFFFCTDLHAQKLPVKKVYAYRQQLLSGKKPAKNEIINTKEQLRVFIELNKKCSFEVTGVWIQSNYYQFKLHDKIKTPVINPGANTNLKFLVPKTNNRVFEIEIISKQEPGPRPGATLGKLLQNNDVVLSYLWKGKTYFATLKTIIELEPFSGL